MAKPTSDRLVHHYDTERHEVLCGTRTADDHSTKHTRGITCGDCAAILRERAEGARSSGGARSSDDVSASSGAGV
jgi:hypothetical protein